MALSTFSIQGTCGWTVSQLLEAQLGHIFQDQDVCAKVKSLLEAPAVLREELGPWKAEGEDYELQPWLYSETPTPTSKNI